MSKLQKTIQLWDTERIGNSVFYQYITPDLSEDDPCKTIMVSCDELIEFIEENEINLLQTDVDDFKTYSSFDCLFDTWDAVVQRYWVEIIQPKLEINYNEAKAYVQSYLSKLTSPINQTKLRTLMTRVRNNYGVTLNMEVA